MGSPVWFVNLIKKLFSARYWVAEFTHLPVVGNLVDYGLFNGDDIIYLPKDNTIQINEPITQSQDVVLPSQVVEHFIDQANYHWIMKFCLCREGNQCVDYPQDYGCIFLGEAVLGINPKFGNLVSKEEAKLHARRCREAGLVHMVGRNKLDTVWLGVGPGHKLLTICNCCPCCCLWKMLPNITPLIADKVTIMPGVKVEVTEQCTGCGTCMEEDVCFVQAIQLVDGFARISSACRGCGRCVEVCPNEAIELTVDDGSFIKETIDRLSPLVDVS